MCASFLTLKRQGMFILPLTFSITCYKDFCDVHSLHLAFSEFYAIDFLMYFLTRKLMSSFTFRGAFFPIHLELTLR